MRQSLKSWGSPGSKLLISKNKNKIKVLENSFCIWPKDANPFFSEILIFFFSGYSYRKKLPSESFYKEY